MANDAHWVANHKIKLDGYGDNCFGLSVINTVQGQSIGIGAPRLWAKPVAAKSADYGEACTEAVDLINEQMRVLMQLRDRIENARGLYEMTGEIPSKI